MFGVFSAVAVSTEITVCSIIIICFISNNKTALDYGAAEFCLLLQNLNSQFSFYENYVKNQLSAELFALTLYAAIDFYRNHCLHKYYDLPNFK